MCRFNIFFFIFLFCVVAAVKHAEAPRPLSQYDPPRMPQGDEASYDVHARPLIHQMEAVSTPILAGNNLPSSSGGISLQDVAFSKIDTDFALAITAKI